MPTSFVLTLDTTGPGGVTLAVNAGAAFTSTPNATANVATTDPATAGYQMKVWGDVLGAPDEASAVWVGFNPALPITLTGGDGLKTVNVRLRDDVGNPSGVVVDAITLDTLTATPTITVDPAPTKISKVAGWAISTFSFAVDDDILQWEVRVVPDANSPRAAGAVIPTNAGSTNTTGGALAPAVNQQVQIHGADLEAASAGDGAKVVKVFVQDDGGSWSS